MDRNIEVRLVEYIFFQADQKQQHVYETGIIIFVL